MSKGEVIVVFYDVTTQKSINRTYTLKLCKLYKSNTSHLIFDESIEEVIETCGPFAANSEEFNEARERLEYKRSMLSTPLGALIWELKNGKG